jgi:hypothetical protein
MLKILFGSVTSKIVNARNLLLQQILRNRNLRIVRNQPIDLKFSDQVTFLPDTKSLLSLARECFLSHGYYPISFSWPKTFDEPQSTKTNAVSFTVPYIPYSYQNSEDYYREYAHSSLAITQRKGGWDCFRHLEIIGAGCIPLFLSAEKIPKYTMIHYPKSLFVAVRKNYKKRAILPSREVAKRLADYANRNLTSRAMCNYFAKLADFNIESHDTILFVDSELAASPDYLSVLNFIGLKQVYGHQVQSLYEEPDYVYTDTTQDVSKLYGRGFGYTKVLERTQRPSESLNEPKIVVVSNLERDLSLVDTLMTSYPNSKFVLFWGSDRPIPKEFKVKDFLSSAVLFCREIS